MATQTFTGVLSIVNCANCGMPFGITDDFEKRRRDDHDTFYCPKGHPQSYGGKSEAERLRDQVALEKRLRGYSEARVTSLSDQLGATERSLRGRKAAKTRIKNRIAAGVCPCCNRSFQDVRRHMEGQHPDFTKGDE